MFSTCHEFIFLLINRWISSETKTSYHLIWNSAKRYAVNSRLDKVMLYFNKKITRVSKKKKQNYKSN
jgi:hypothetical protein